MIIQCFKESKELIKFSIRELITASEMVNAVELLRRREGRGGFKNQYEEQIKNECQLFNIYLQSIDEAIGTNMDDKFLGNKVGLKEFPSDDPIFKKIYEDQKLIKTYRLSKKIFVSQELNERKIMRQVGKKVIEVEIPRTYYYCQEPLCDFIQERVGKDVTARKIEATAFKSLVISKPSFLLLLEKQGLLIKDIPSKSDLEFKSSQMQLHKKKLLKTVAPSKLELKINKNTGEMVLPKILNVTVF